jgi:ERCC4-type nuclease
MPMQGSIVVDTNAGETALYQALVRRFDAATVTRRKLDVGDVMLVADAGTVYVERKTWLDWAKSLSDGRYANQKARLLAAARGGDVEDDDEGEAPATTTTATTAVLYLVEGALAGWSGKVAGGGGGMGPVSKMTNAQLEAAVVMTAVRDGVPVLRSKDHAHSLELLAYLFQKLRAGELLLPSGGAAAASSSSSGYAGLVVKKRPRDNLTTQTTWAVMLAQVSGMSAHKAAAVAAAFPTMAALSAASEEQLAGVLVPPASASTSASSTASTASGGGGKTKKARRLGPQVAKRLAQL